MFLMMECVVLFMAGTVAVWFFATGRIDVYLQGYLRYLALAGGLSVMVMGLFNWFTRDQSARCCHDHDHGTDGHHHSHEASPGSRGLTLLCIAGAVSTAAAMTPDAYTSSYLQNKELAQRQNRGRAAAPVSKAVAASRGASGIDQEKFDKYASKNAAGDYILDVINLSYAGSDGAYVDFLTGRKAESTGQIVVDSISPGPGHYRLYVLQVNCCMSDARPFSIPILLADEKAQPRENGWHRVIGKLDFIMERGVKMARLIEATATPIPRPGQTGPMGLYR